MQRLVSYNINGQRQWGVLTADGNYIYSAEDLEETYFILSERAWNLSSNSVKKAS